MRLIRSTLTLILSTLVGCADIPDLFLQRKFTSASLATAVNHYVAMGEDAAVKELGKIASNRHYAGPGLCLPERVSWVCLILFAPKENKPLRSPPYGTCLPFNTMPSSKWPLFPICLSGDSYFVLDRGYASTGPALDRKSYLNYCRVAGIFRKEPVKIPTRQQAQSDVKALRSSPAWRAIKWTDSGPWFSYAMQEESEWEFIRVQADAIQ